MWKKKKLKREKASLSFSSQVVSSRASSLRTSWQCGGDTPTLVININENKSSLQCDYTSSRITLSQINECVSFSFFLTCVCVWVQELTQLNQANLNVVLFLLLPLFILHHLFLFLLTAVLSPCGARARVVAAAVVVMFFPFFSWLVCCRRIFSFPLNIREGQRARVRKFSLSLSLCVSLFLSPSLSLSPPLSLSFSKPE